MFASIVLLSPPYSSLTYEAPDVFPDGFFKKGMRVAVPLGGKNRISIRAGYIKKLHEESGLDKSVKCREILWPLETDNILDDELVSLAADLALRYGLPEGAILGQALPSGLRTTGLKIKLWENGKATEIRLGEIAALPRPDYARLANALCAGAAFMPLSEEDEASRELCLLNIDPPWPVRPAARRQIEILDFLHERGMVSRKQLVRQLGSASSRPLATLLAAGLVTLRIDEDEGPPKELLPPPETRFELNSDQKNILSDLEKKLDGTEAKCTLLYGVTGSGKTAVYLHLAEKCLEIGKSVILLAPEVALAYKLYRDTCDALPHFAAWMYHGYQQPRRREGIFRELAGRKDPFILVGTRSALFLPLVNIGCIILDEEHDGSFKQDENFPYHAKEVAWFRMKRNKGLLLLGSATPDIKTFYYARKGNFNILPLRNRVGGRALPPVELVDIGKSPGLAAAGTLSASAKGQTLLGEDSENALRKCLEDGDQAVIMLNRRGYSPMIYCVNCAKILRCPHCEIGLSFHKGVQKLLCHYCGYSMPYPQPCPDCGKIAYMPIGEGTEKLAEKLEAIAGKPILRLDRDSTRRPGRMEEILAAFGRNESPFLVGTQMLSKGHHFPHVTLVVVADGDIGLNLPDYRAAERTFQLLVQAAGRAGRGEKPGRVLIQTRNPSHYCWDYIRNYDYEGFYADELARREKRLYPPFINLGLLRISYDIHDEHGPSALRDVADTLRPKARDINVHMLGPAPAPIAMLRGRKRFQCLFKSHDWSAIRQMYFYAKNLKSSRHKRIGRGNLHLSTENLSLKRRHPHTENAGFQHIFQILFDFSPFFLHGQAINHVLKFRQNFLHVIAVFPQKVYPQRFVYYNYLYLFILLIFSP